MTCTASQAPLAGPEGRWLSPSRKVDGVLDLDGLQFQGVGLPVGDEGVIAVVGASRAWVSPGGL